MQRCKAVYLDYNATTPIYQEVAEEMMPFLDSFGNPSSSHAFGRPCRDAVVLARSRVANLVNARPEEIFFTSCGTESDNWAISSSVKLRGRCGGDQIMPHVVTSNIEHPAVIECLRALEADGLASYTEVPVGADGIVSVEAVEAAMRDETVLVTVMHSNNEIGSIQPIAELSALAHSRGALMHTDAAQSIGKVEVDVCSLSVDLLTIVGHKFGAPKGVAALFISDRVKSFPSFFHGGGQEGGRRAGTENVLLIAGLGKAAEVSKELLRDGWMREHAAEMRARLLDGIRARLPDGSQVKINGPEDEANRLPNTLSLSIPGVSANQVLSDLSEEVAASAGAACHSGGATMSAVLGAIGLTQEEAMGTLRLSTGRYTTKEDVERAADLIVKRAVASSGSLNGSLSQ